MESIMTAAATLALAMAATVSIEAAARGGASGLSQPPKTALVPMMATMQPATCPDCKETWVTQRTVFKGAPTLIGRTEAKAVHFCPECKTEWRNSGHGKAAAFNALHLCPSCQGGH